MPGFRRQHRRNSYGRAFPHSRYDDPRGGRPSALERNILRYRSTEVSLYLFYAEEIRDFMLTNIGPGPVKSPSGAARAAGNSQPLQDRLFAVLDEAENAGKLSSEDVRNIRHRFVDDRQSGKKLKAAFRRAVQLGAFTEDEARELQDLLAYRNDIAHRIHLVMSDISRTYWAADHLSFYPPTYKGDALDRLRAYRKSLWDRTKSLTIALSMDGLLFEAAERVYEEELKRLECLIQKQIRREQTRTKTISAELDLTGTELVDDLEPRFPANFHSNRRGGPDSGHLTKRGVEICFRLFDMGKSPIAVAYLMGMSLRAAQVRQRSWLKAGGLKRKRADIKRYDLSRSRRKLAAR